MLSLNFKMYTVGGVWRPVGWSSSIAKLLYNIFTIVTLALMYILAITQFTDIVLVIDNLDDFATNALMFPTIVAVCFKGTIVVTRRKAIIKLMQTLLEEPHKPRDEDEIAIQRKFDRFIKYAELFEHFDDKRVIIS